MSLVRPVPDGATVRLRLLSTTDLHMQLTGHDYCAGRADQGVGLTRVATLIATAREEAARDGALTLLFDNGDAFQGGAFSELAGARPDADNPMMRAFAHLRYDALGLGNHDFDLGLAQLEAVLNQASCPVVCSNLRRVVQGKSSGFEQHAVLDRIVTCEGSEYPLRIGVLSFLPPQTVMWNRHRLGGQIAAEDMLAAAKTALPGLIGQGCDIVVALAHSGFGAEHAEPGAENAAWALAALDGIDAVIAGHTHQLFPAGQGPDLEQGLMAGKPVVMAGASGSHLGVIDLTLTAAPDGRWRPSAVKSSLRPVAVRGVDGAVQTGAEEDPGLTALLADDLAEAVALMAQPIGEVREPLHSYFSFFAPDRALAVVAAAQVAALRPLLARMPEGDLPLLSAAAPGKFGDRAGPASYTDIPAGPVLLRHLIDLQVFQNDLQAIVVTGDQLADWIEMSVGLFRRIEPGSNGDPLVDPAMPGHDFDVIHGVTCAIDLSQPARFFPDGELRDGDFRRVRDLCHMGEPVDEKQRFVVALSSYRANGGGRFAALRSARVLDLPRIPVRDALRRYLSGAEPADLLEHAPPPWSFVPMPGTRVSVVTGPGARRYLGELAARGVEVEGFDAEGFLRLTLPL